MRAHALSPARSQTLLCVAILQPRCLLRLRPAASRADAAAAYRGLGRRRKAARQPSARYPSAAVGLSVAALRAEIPGVDAEGDRLDPLACAQARGQTPPLASQERTPRVAA